MVDACLAFLSPAWRPARLRALPIPSSHTVHTSVIPQDAFISICRVFESRMGFLLLPTTRIWLKTVGQACHGCRGMHVVHTSVIPRPVVRTRTKEESSARPG